MQFRQDVAKVLGGYLLLAVVAILIHVASEESIETLSAQHAATVLIAGTFYATVQALIGKKPIEA